MTDQVAALNQKLDQLLAKSNSPAATAAAPVMAPAMMPAATFQQFTPSWGGQQAFAPVGAIQPTGISIPVNLMLPDGSELQFRIHFGPEHAASPQALQAFAQMAMQTFGQALKVYRPRFGNGFGGGYGNSFNGGGYRRGRY